MNRKRILVVDDEQEIAEQVKLTLEENGYEVTVAFEGQEALEKARNDIPDLMILDIMLPKMDGYRVCALLKKDARYAAIPIILFTGKAHEEDHKMSEEAGADAYLTKPFEASALLSKIEKLTAKPSTFPFPG